MNIEKDLNNWMDEHQTEYFELIREAMEEFESAHPGMDDEMVKINALSMADRRFMARALGQVLPRYLGQQQSGS